jgi:hypothetical protein
MIRSYDDIVLPLDGYRGSMSEQAIAATAREELTARCMEALGYEGYPVSDLTYLTLEPLHGNTFGIVSEAQARETGFTPAWIREAELGGELNLERFDGWPGGVALSGGTGGGPTGIGVAPATSGSDGVPEGGCYEEGRRNLYALADAEPPELAWFDLLEGKAFAAATQDPRMTQVTKAFSLCIQKRGYDYDEPLDAEDDDRWYVPAGEELTPAVRDAALAVVGCKHESRYTDTLVAITAELQQETIEENAEQLTYFSEARERIMTAIREQGLGTLGGREGGTPP